MEKEIIIGIHSISLAIGNNRRSGKILYGTSDSILSLRKMNKLDLNQVEVVEVKSTHEIQQRAEKIFKKYGNHYHRRYH